jgi:hypothetical protein
MEEVNKVLKDAARVLEEALVDGILQERLLKTGELARSVKVKFDERTSEFSIRMEDYGYYQDSGVHGTKVRQPFNPESLYDPGQFRSKVIGGPLPFPVRKTIAEKGFRPRPFITMAVERTLGSLEDDISDAGLIDIDKDIINIFKKNGAKT